MPSFIIEVDTLAIQKIKEVIAEKPAGTFFKINIVSGGCAGFTTSFALENTLQSDDIIIKDDEGARVVINKTIAEFIKHAELKYTKGLLSSFFTLVVKTATENCSCGSSFGI